MLCIFLHFVCVCTCIHTCMFLFLISCAIYQQIRVKRATIERFGTYGELYQGLCSATGEIPIAVYRTERQAGALKPMPGEVCQSSMDCLYDSPSKKKKKVFLTNIDCQHQKLILRKSKISQTFFAILTIFNVWPLR